MIRKLFENACDRYLEEIYSGNFNEKRCAARCRQVEGWASQLEQAGELTEHDNYHLYRLHTQFEARSIQEHGRSEPAYNTDWDVTVEGGAL